jgi:hypothetical protein
MSTTKSLRTHQELCGPTPEFADYLRHTLRDGLTAIKQKAGPLEAA